MSINGNNFQKFIRIFSTFFILFLVTNFVFALLQVLNSPFDHDELQHVHIGWNVFNGKLIYKDFFEHHGPIFAFFNGILFELFSLKPEVQTLITLRLVSLAFLILILLMTYLIAVEFFKTKFAGLFSASLLSGLLFIREAATEIRPDVLQNALWLFAVYICLVNINKRKKYLSLSAGLIFGISVMTNSKAAVGVASIFLYLFIRWFISTSNKKEIIIDGLIILSGIVFIFSIIALYFHYKNSFTEFFFYNYEFNLIALMEYHSRNLKEYAGVLIKSQTTFVLACITSLLIYISNLTSRKELNDNPEKLFIVIVTIVTSSTIFLGLYKQQYLLFLPLLAVVIFNLVNILMNKVYANKMNVLLPSLLIILLFGNLLYASIYETPFKQSEEQKQQNKLTQFILDNYERDEPVFFLWNNQGGYMFNEDVQYFWLENEGFRTLFNRIVGYEVFGDSLINNLQQKNVRYLVTSQKHLKMVLSEDAYKYILLNFSNENEFNGYLWIRKK